MAIRVRVWLAAAASRHPVSSACRPKVITFYPVPEKRVGTGQPVGDQAGQRLAVRVVPGLLQCLAELPLGLTELARGERHRAQHAAAQRGRRRGFHRLAQGHASRLLGQHQV